MGPIISIIDLAAEMRSKPTAEITIPYTVKAPKIDGKISEDVWGKSVALSQFVKTLTGLASDIKTDVKLMWNNKFLYIAMVATDSDISSQFTKNDEDLWKEDSFEIFLMPGDDKYFDIQINPKGLVMDSFLPKYHQDKKEWSSNIKISTRIDGSFNDAKSGDKSWTAEMAIPFAALVKEGITPPSDGSTWKANFFRIDKNGQDTQYSAWSAPLRGDFHTTSRFGKIIFKK
jgi:hypothetical protein